MNRGDTAFVTKDNVLGLRYRDKKDVYFLSTLHRPRLVATKKTDKEGTVIMKDNVVTDYNTNMGFVDKNDQVVTQHTMVRKSLKWTTKVFLHLIEEVLLNAHVLYKQSNQPYLDFSDFKLSYVRDVLSLDEKNLGVHKGIHYPKHIPATEKSRFPVKRCVVCYKNGTTRTSRYCCPECISNPGLCVTPCFKIFHEN